MKKSIKIFSALLLTMMVTGCGGSNNSSSSKPSSSDSALSSESSLDATSSEDVASSSSSLKEDEAIYTVKVVYEDGSPVVNSEISGQWCDDSSKCSPFSLGENGEFAKTMKKGNYTVHLFNLPDGYTYNPNIYVASATEHTTTITLIKVSAFLEGDGAKYTSYVFQEGTYVAKNKNKNIIYYSFKPSRPGIFSIESMADELDPVLGYYGGNDNFIPDNALESDDDSGLKKNFKYEFEVADDYFVHKDEPDENGNPQFELDEKGNLIPGSKLIFGISLKDESVTEEFAFTVKYEREYVAPVKEITMVEAKEAGSKYADNTDSDYTFKQVKMDGSVTPVYNENDGYYHANSANGKILLANLKAESDYFDLGLYLMQDASATKMFLLDSGTKDYTDFVAKYATICNADGVTPVTKELQEFLSLFAKEQGYFIANGWLSSMISYEVPENLQWLFVVGTYTSIYDEPFGGQGTSASPYNVDCGTYKFNVNGFNATWFTLYAMGEADYVISSPKESAILLDTNFCELTSTENGFSYTVHLEPRESITLGVCLSSGNNESVVVKIKEKSDNEIGDRDNIVVGKNIIEISDSEAFFGVEVAFTAPEAGTYKFIPDDSNSVIWSDDFKGEYYSASGNAEYFEIELEALESFPFSAGTVDYAAGTCTFYIELDDGSLSYEDGDFFLGENTVNFKDTEEALWGIGGYFIAPQDGDYKITCTDNAYLFVADGYSLYSGDSETFTLEKGEQFYIVAGADDYENQLSCTFTIEFADNGGGTVSPTKGDFVVGTNEVIFEDAQQAYDGIGGYFIAPQDGEYKITSTDNAYINLLDGAVNLYSGDDYTLELEEGDQVYLLVGADDYTKYNCSFTIELIGGGSSTPTQDCFVVGTNSITFANAQEAYDGIGKFFTAEEDGLYTITSTDNAYINLLDGEIILYSGDDYTLDLEAGDQVYIMVGADDYTNYSCTFTITYSPLE